jgi:hypothetical protein
VREFFTAAFWRDAWWYLAHPGYLAYGYSPSGPATPGQPPKGKSGAPCSHSGIGVSAWFDRTVCPEPCSSMHDRCTLCGRAVGGCPLESADGYEATTGHAITCGAGFGAGCQCDDEGRPPCDHCDVVGHSFEDCPEGETHYGDNGNGISGQHTGRVEDCTGPGCGPRDCEAMAATADMSFGPCVKREGHKGWHEDADGSSWTERCRGCGHTEGEGCGCPPAPTLSVPREALRGLVRVARCVSRGDSGWLASPPLDLTARRALGALDDAGLLEQFREGGDG